MFKHPTARTIPPCPPRSVGVGYKRAPHMVNVNPKSRRCNRDRLGLVLWFRLVLCVGSIPTGTAWGFAMIRIQRDSAHRQVCVLRVRADGGSGGEVKGTARRHGDGFKAHAARLVASLNAKGQAAKPYAPPAPTPHIIIKRVCECPPCDHALQPCRVCAVGSGCAVHIPASSEPPKAVGWRALGGSNVDDAEFEVIHGMTLKAWMKAHNK